MPFFDGCYFFLALWALAEIVGLRRESVSKLTLSTTAARERELKRFTAMDQPDHIEVQSLQVRRFSSFAPETPFFPL